MELYFSRTLYSQASQQQKNNIQMNIIHQHGKVTDGFLYVLSAWTKVVCSDFLATVSLFSVFPMFWGHLEPNKYVKQKAEKRMQKKDKCLK